MFRSGSILPLLLLNLVAVVGVLQWGWVSFDLIFLYWLENVVIGAFMLMRMVARRYEHPLELIMPLLLAPFFLAHYGMFCYVHGQFVVGLFAPEALSALSVVAVAQQMLTSTHLQWGLGALIVLHLILWSDEIRRTGLGAQGVKDLMTQPYRRIVVLHLTILLGGFTLAAFDEPTLGLLLLILLKIGSDVWHSRKDTARATDRPLPAVSDEMLRQMQAEFPEPKFTVNGQERRFASFAELKASREFRFVQTVTRMMGASAHLEAMNRYIDMKIAEERAI